MKYFLLVISCITLFACKKDKPGGGTGSPTPPGGGGNTSSKEITSFVLTAAANNIVTDITGDITGDTIRLILPSTANITQLVPKIIHTGASISPANATAVNLTNPVNYTVTATDNSQRKYVVVAAYDQSEATVFGGTNNGTFYAIDAATGIIKWSYTAGGSIRTPPTVNATRTLVYFTCGDKNLYALDAATGVLKWKYAAQTDPSVSTPVYEDGKIYIESDFSPNTAPGGFSNPRVYTVDAATGTQVGFRTDASVTQFHLTVINGRIYSAGFYNLLSRDASTGANPKVYTYDICGGNPAVLNGVLYGSTESSVVSAYDAASGTLIWRGGMGNSNGSPTIADNKVFNTDYTNGLYAFDLATGVQKWVYKSFSGDFLAPVAANGMVYAGTNGTGLYAINGSTGELAWLRNTLKVGHTTVAATSVFAGTDGQLYHLDALTGTTKWTMVTNGQINAAIVASVTGVVYRPGISGEQQ